ncbi:MAG: SigB/SigF/SigG family RNA polymerase sigma factor [Solirubrobacterales bacterium]|nr:SigB/SigF/SigG family RNA polymerase sigma factor [Solirubrobacterales bacterium]
MTPPASAVAPPAPPSEHCLRGRARDEAIAELVPLAHRLAGRYRHSGEAREDLEQVACLGLVKAVDRYDPDAGPLVRYAVPTILGELRRHFRDRGWGLHVPRGVQENFLRCNEAADRLWTRLGRTPTVGEIAAEAGISVEDAIEALDAGRSYTPAALDAPTGGDLGDDSARTLGDTIGRREGGFARVELGQAIGPAFDGLPEREREIVRLRFFEDLTQSEIAGRVGISQMHVSRLLRRALDKLHAAVDEGSGAGYEATAL